MKADFSKLESVQINLVSMDDQRYDTVGDWLFSADSKTLTISVSELPKTEMFLCVALHELVEAALCAQRGIDEEAVTKFDTDFENNRAFDDISEPGDAIEAPYHMEHQIATAIEKQFASALNLDWKEYDDAVNAL